MAGRGGCGGSCCRRYAREFSSQGGKTKWHTEVQFSSANWGKRGANHKCKKEMPMEKCFPSADWIGSKWVCHPALKLIFLGYIFWDEQLHLIFCGFWFYLVCRNVLKFRSCFFVLHTYLNLVSLFGRVKWYITIKLLHTDPLNFTATTEKPHRGKNVIYFAAI